MCLQVSTPGSRVRFWGCSLAGLSRTARGLKRLSAMDTLYLMPDGWWEIKDNMDGAAAKLELKWMKSVSPALQIQASPFFFNEGKLFSWCNFCCRLMDYRSDITPVQCDICSTLITWWMCDKSMPESKASIVSSFQASQTRHVFMQWGAVGYGWTSVQCAWGNHRCVWIVNDKWVNGAIIYFTNDKTKEKGPP